MKQGIGDDSTSRKERDILSMHWPHLFTVGRPLHVVPAAYGSMSTRTDDRDESEWSLSSSYLPFSLLGGLGQDLSLRRTRCS